MFIHDLATLIFRDCVQMDGKWIHEEHCRVCHKVGEMLVCDLCPAVYHMACLDPPLEVIPHAEWMCLICENNEYLEKGTVDGGSYVRENIIGRDRHGSRFWFVSNR